MKAALKLSAGVLGGLIVLMLALGGAVMVIGNTAAGRVWIEKLTYKFTSGVVRLSGLNGSLPTQLTLNELQLVDRQGVWLSAEHISLTWSPLRWLDGRLQVDTLHVEHLHMQRRPVSDRQGGKASIPHIEVGKFSMDSVELAAPLVGKAVTLAAQGRLRLRSLEDADADFVVRRLDGDGDYTLHAKFDPERMDATLAVHEPASGPLENLLSLPGLGALSAIVSFQGPRNAEVIDVSLTAGGLRARLQGRVDVTHRSADVEYSLQAPAMTPRPELTWDNLALHGNFHGSLNAPIAKGHLSVDKLRIAGSTRIAALSAELAASGGTLAMQAVASGVEIPGPQPQFFAKDAFKLEGSMRLDAPSYPLDFSATHPLLALHGHANTVAQQDGEQRASVALRLPNLAPYSVFTGQQVKGSADLNARLTHRSSDDALASDARVDITGSSASWVAFAGAHLAAQLSGVVSADVIKIDSLKLTGRGVTFAASGSANRAASPPDSKKDTRDALARVFKDLQARWQLEVADLAAVASSLAGDVKLSGRVSGPPAALTADADVVSHVSVRGSARGTVIAKVQVRGLPSASNVMLQAHGVLDDAPLTLDASLDRGVENSFRLAIRHAAWKTAHLGGDLTANAALTISRGQLNLQIGQLSDLERLIGTQLAGNAQGSIAFVPGPGHAQAQVKLVANDLKVGHFAGSVHLQALGSADQLGIQLQADMPQLNGFPATLESKAELNMNKRELHLATASLGYRGTMLRLLAPAEVSFVTGLAVDDLKLGAQDALLEVKGKVSPTLDLQASLRQVKPALINVFSPGLLAAGLIEGQVRLEGNPTSPTGRIQIDASDIRFADDAATGLPALELHARALLADSAAALNATLSAGGQSGMTAAGNIPLDANGVLDLKIGGKFDLSLANPFLEARGMRASGELTADATVTGSSADPIVGGGLTLARGSLRDYGRGVSLSDISAEIAGHEGALQIKSFKATATSGTIGMSGSLGILQPGMPIELKITARNAQPIVSNILTANLDADLQVTGTLRQRVDVGGAIHVNRATIGIPSSLPPDVAVLDVRRRGRELSNVQLDKQLVVGINIVIQAPQEVLVQGRGLDAEMGGEIKVTGTSDALLVSGGLDLRRGSFTLVGNKLSLSEGGRVSFDGAGLRKKIDPTLDFTAATTLADSTVTLRITGVADAPKLEFTSSPALPQDEIMARLLFGQNVAALTALQAAQIGYALATLSGVGGGGGFNPLVKLQKTLGLDRLSVGASTNTATGATGSGAAVAAGRYVSKRVYIEGKQSTTGSTQVQVDVELTKHLKLQTRLGNGSAITQGTTPENDPGSSVGLSYQFEY